MSTVTLAPTGTSIITSLGTLSGVWPSDGVNTPVGALLWLNHSNGAGNLSWTLYNVTQSTTLIPTQTLTAAQFDALVTATDAAGYKQVPLRIINPAYGAQAAGDTISFTLSAASKWQVKTGAVTAGKYAMVAVPEPTVLGVVAVIGAALVGRYLRTVC